ncbi:hypothetical protein BDW22DRAFT_752161 [Trametopsis cervina]|nr:hypothetical protein BDW22DRAFT_752161 [Trametopsis cervina]
MNSNSARQSMPATVQSSAIQNGAQEIMQIFAQVMSKRYKPPLVEAEAQTEADEVQYLKDQVNKLQITIDALKREVQEKDTRIKTLSEENANYKQENVFRKNIQFFEPGEDAQTVMPQETYSEPASHITTLEDLDIVSPSYSNFLNFEDEPLQPDDSFNAGGSSLDSIRSPLTINPPDIPTMSSPPSSLFPPVQLHNDVLPPESDVDSSSEPDAMSASDDETKVEARSMSVSSSEQDGSSSPLIILGDLRLPEVFTPGVRAIRQVRLVVSPPRPHEKSVFVIDRPVSPSGDDTTDDGLSESTRDSDDTP